MTANAWALPERQQASGRRPTGRAFVMWLAVGLILGAVISGLITASRPQVFSAEAVIAITPSSTIPDAGSDGQDLTSLVQSELILLNGPQLRARVAEVGGGGTGGFSGSQVGNTGAVTVTAVASSPTMALDTAALAVRLYAEGREERLRGEIAKAAKTVDVELSRIETNIEAGVTGASALQGEYGRLLAVRSGLFRADANADSAVGVIQPPTDSSAGRLGGLVRSLVSGGLAGSLLAVSALMLHRRFSRRVRSEGDVADVDQPVLRPALPRCRSRRGPLSADGRLARPARFLSAQLVPTVDQTSVVVVCAPHRHAGTSWTAAALAASLVERCRVLLVLAADADELTGSSPLERLGETAPLGLSELDGRALTPQLVEASARPTSVSGLVVLSPGSSAGEVGLVHRLVDQGLIEACRGTGRVVVVDAPALSESSAGLDMGTRADAFALVVGLGVTDQDDIDVAVDLLRRRRIDLAGVVLDHPTPRWRQRWQGEDRRPQKRSHAPDVDGDTDEDRLPLFEQAFPTTPSIGYHAPATGPHAATRVPGPDDEEVGASGGDPRELPGGQSWPRAQDSSTRTRPDGSAMPTGWVE